MATQGSLVAEAPGLVASAALVGGGMFRLATDAVALRRFECGDSAGLVLAIATGNEKDEGSAYAATAAVVAVLEAFHEPLLSEADLPPVLRRAILDAHDAIVAVGREPLPRSLATAFGPRRSLRGIGASLTVVAIRPGRLHGVHVGEGRAFLRRDAKTQKLTLEHTLANTAEFRRRDGDWRDAGELLEAMAGSVVVKVLGVTPEAPQPDVFRCELSAGDQVVVGNMLLSTEVASQARDTTAGKADDGTPYREAARAVGHSLLEDLSRRMQQERPLVNASVGVVSVC